MGSIRSFPWDSVNTNPEVTPPKWDRPSSAKDFRDVLSKFFSTGVFMDSGTSLQVVASSDMSVTVKKGSAIVNGTVAINDADEAISLSGSDQSLPRIDTIVARWNANNDARYIKLFVLKGNAASSPVRPALTRNESVYEIGLADVYVPAGSTSLTQQRITDTRLETGRCGASAPYAEFDTSALFDQLKNQVDSNLALIQSAIDGTTAGKLQDAIDAVEATTGTLQGEIDAVEAAVSGLSLKMFPVGSVYQSLENVSPASFMGGTWQRITGRFLYCTTNTNTGGSNTHTLTVNEMPKHGHPLFGAVTGRSASASQTGNVWEAVRNAGFTVDWANTATSGGSKSHNNMPAYQGVYAWRRTA